ncbi:MAG: DUF1573 domain-containing protein [Bacillota bacterium]
MVDTDIKKTALVLWMITAMFFAVSRTATAATALPPSTGRAFLYAPQPEIDFGSATEGDKVFLEYVIENRGDAPFEIAAITPVCDCIKAEIISGSRNLQPGDRLVLMATFDTKNFAYEQFKWITISDRHGTAFRVYLKGMIKPRPGSPKRDKYWRPTKVLPRPSSSIPETSTALLIRYFYTNDCGKCQKIIRRVLTPLEKSLKGKIWIIYYNIHDKASYDVFIKLQDYYHFSVRQWPVILIRDDVLEGDKQIETNLAGYVRYHLSAFGKTHVDAPASPADNRRNAAKKWLAGFNMWTIMAAGLIDGINPCAFATLIFFISFLTAGKYTRKKILLIGAAFLAVSFLTYVLIGLGVFNFLRSLNSFHLISLLMGVAIALFSLVLGLISLRDYMGIRQGKDLREISLQLPARAKQIIHHIIRKSFKQPENGGMPRNASILKLVMISSVTSFMITLTESICTGQVYLPVLALISESNPSNMKALSLISLYNAFFIVPLASVLILALVFVSLPGLGDFQRKHLSLVKLATGIFFLALAALLAAAYILPLM